MGDLHWHYFAYLRGDERAVTALGRLFHKTTEASVMPADPNRVGRPVLCVDIESLQEVPVEIRDEIARADTTPFDEFLRAHPTWDDDADSPTFARERARVRTMIWLSDQIGGPVGCWYHEGDNGMLADRFLGFGSQSLMWDNDREGQGPDWDDTKPRGAYTAALWHVGAMVPNVGEYESAFRAYGWPRARIEALSEQAISSLATADPARFRGVWAPPPRQQHNQPMQWTGAAGMVSFVRKLLGRGPGH